MKYFRENTLNKIVVCGLNTLMSFPGSKPLKNRSTIVICPEGYERDDCYCIHDFDEMIKLLKELSKTQEVFVIGGAYLYSTTIKYVDRVYVTHVDAVDPEAEVFFPDLNKAGFKVTAKTSIQEEGEYKFRMVTYERRT
jgi:dihydrofolate reductase